VIKIVVPALRERIEDLPALVRVTARRLCALLGVAEPAFADSFYERLTTHDWPGNVRELVNVLERLLVRGEVRVLEASDLDDLLDEDVTPSPEPGAAERTLERRAPVAVDPDEAVEAELIANALRETGGNVARVARRVEMSRAKVRHRIQKYRLQDLAHRD
jgi:two-component system response regulator AtoC